MACKEGQFDVVELKVFSINSPLTAPSAPMARPPAGLLASLANFARFARGARFARSSLTIFPIFKEQKSRHYLGVYRLYIIR